MAMACRPDATLQNACGARPSEVPAFGPGICSAEMTSSELQLRLCTCRVNSCRQQVAACSAPVSEHTSPGGDTLHVHDECLYACSADWH